MSLPVAFDVTAVKPNSGGVHRYVNGLLHNLPPEVNPWCISRSNDSEDWPNVVRVAPPTLYRRVAWEQYGLVQAVHSLQCRPEILHSVHYTMPLLARGMRRVVTIHDVAWLRPKELQVGGPWFPFAKRLIFPRAIRRALRSADAVVCVSERVATRLQDEPKVKAEISLIPHGVDTARFTSTPSDDEDAILFGLDSDYGIRPPYILFVGAVEPRKNVGSLVRAFEMIEDQLPDFQLVLAGEAWPGCEISASNTTLERLIEQRRLIQTGFFPEQELPALVRNAAAFIYPSFEEGFGLPVLESLACGTPTITSVDTVMSDIGGNATVTIDPSSPGEIGDAILDVVGGKQPDPVLGQEIARRLSWIESAQRHAVLYDRLH